MTRPILAHIHLDSGRPAENAEALREVFSRWASGVTVVAARTPEGISGLTVSAFAPLSIDPPLVVIAISGDAPVLTAIRDARRFTVNVLASDQKRTANVFADRFPVTMPPFLPGDDAVIDAALAAIVCDLDVEHDGGDHRIVIGRVRIAFLGSEKSPLIHYRRSYPTLA